MKNIFNWYHMLLKYYTFQLVLKNKTFHWYPDCLVIIGMLVVCLSIGIKIFLIKNLLFWFTLPICV